VRFAIERAEVENVIGRLARRDPRTGEDARAAIEWLTADEEEDAPAVFTRHRLQLFLCYELPRKWLVEPDEHLAVAEALGLFFDEFGPSTAPLGALCRDPETSRLLRDEGEGFVEAIEASGLQPPDTPLLEWSDLMTLARPRRGILRLGPRGRSMQADPSALLSTIASTIATTGGSAQLDLAVAALLRGDKQDLDVRLLDLLGPFYGIIGGRFRREAEVTPGGGTLAAAILRARAYGPRHSFA
jgi:hypothetical protein